jgi:protein phosphatase 2C family protein 2/3
LGVNDPIQKDLYRVNPGNLNISRSFGDINLKQTQQGILVAEPDISEVSIGPDSDFIMICCDGIFDCLSTKDTIETAWK